MCSWKTFLPVLALGLSVAAAVAQTPGDALPPVPTTPAAPPADGIVAKVNGQAIPEKAIQRCFRTKGVPPNREADARPAFVEFLIDTALVDQYLAQLKVEVDPKEVDAKVGAIYAEIKKQNPKVEEVLQNLLYTEAEFHAQVEADLRWDKFTSGQATDEKLQKFFESNRDSFDGSQVRARHILLMPSPSDTKAAEAAIAQLQGMKKKAEEAAKGDVAKLPANADEFTKKKTYNDSLESAFAELARNHSVCPSRKAGGDVDWFERTHGMVEPFAKAAFALQPYQMSDVVKTKYGYHLILVTDRRPGHEVKFEEVKPLVKDVFSDRLREAVLSAMRPRAKIEMTPTKTGP
jgi:peptidyl-prolyl cis-trans isomerase C